MDLDKERRDIERMIRQHVNRPITRCTDDEVSTALNEIGSNAPILGRALIRSNIANLFSRYLCISTQRHGIIKSKFADLQIPTDVSLPQYLMSKFDEYGDRVAMVDAVSNHSYTYRQLKDFVRRCGSGLVKSGFKHGDVCALYQPNMPEFSIASYAVASIGGVISPINPTFTVVELSRQLDHTDAKWIITIPSCVDKAKEAVKRVWNIKGIYVVGDEGVDGCKPFSTLMRDDGSAFPTGIKINPKEDLVILLYSGGTTGLPKGVMITHHNIISNIEEMNVPRGLRIESGNDVIVAVTPFFFAGGFILFLSRGLHLGCKLITLPVSIPEQEMILRCIEEHKATSIIITAAYLQFLAKDPLVDKYDLSSVKYILVGGAPCASEVIESAKRRLSSKNKEVIIRQGYGQTESSGIVTLASPSKELPPDSVGILIPNTEAKVVSLETGEILGAGEDGELCFRGPQIMKGYLKNEKATNETLVDGWLYTGDIGYYDETGHFFVVDRSKELIKYKGFQVSPAELEGLLLTNPDIQDVAVIGLPDEEAGELPKAFVVPKSNKLTPEDVIKFVEENVAPYKKLSGGVEFIHKIPISGSGKKLRRDLRDKEMERIGKK
ncbi:putative 4-coumarate--CoA ligase 1 [Glandiceps talaboti]